jgi:O-antigen ligase
MAWAPGKVDDRHAPVSDGIALGPDLPVTGDRPATDDAPGTSADGFAVTALMLLPGALIVFMGFNAGGYFPATPAIVAIVLAQILLVRVMQARRPFEGLAPATLVAIAALGLYALMTLVSASWSHSTGQALIEFDRAWLYLLILLLFGSVRPSTQSLRWFVRGLLLGVSIVCLAGLISRVLPDIWHTAPEVSNERLSYPVTYWNALGLLAALGIVLAFHLTCSLRERRLARVLAAAVIPLLAATLFFTFSRGAIVAGSVGLVLYILVARPRGLLSGVLATAPATIALIAVAYHANLLDTIDPTTPAAVSQGHRVALVAGICAVVCAGLRVLLAVGLDPRLILGRSGVPRMSRGTLRGALAAAAAVVVVVGLALGVPHAAANDWHRFFSGATPHGNTTDLRQRLTDPANNGRTDLWRVALHGFAASPLHGYGAGMYQTLWDRNRPYFVYTINAHSLYLQALAELGVPGLLLLLVLVGVVLGALAVRVRRGGSRRSLYGALLACGIVWALHAGVDWDWEMPVVTFGFFAAAGLALSPRKGSSGPGWVPGNNSRMILGLLCLATLVTPVLIIGSQNRLEQAESALYTSNCAKAGSAALSSIGWLDVRPEPFEILGFCDIRRGLPKQAVAAMRRAVRLDPGGWETYYALAIAQASAGIDPRAAAQRALRMNPREPLTGQAVRELRTSAPTEWVSRAPVVLAAALASKDLSIVPS